MNIRVDENTGPIWAAFCDWFLSELINAQVCPGGRYAHAEMDAEPGWTCPHCKAAL